MANIQHRKIQIDNMAPVHGDVTTFRQFTEEAIALTAKPQVPVERISSEQP
jgi:hypothetical protein